MASTSSSTSDSEYEEEALLALLLLRRRRICRLFQVSPKSHLLLLLVYSDLLTMEISRRIDMGARAKDQGVSLTILLPARIHSFLLCCFLE